MSEENQGSEAVATENELLNAFEAGAGEADLIQVDPQQQEPQAETQSETTEEAAPDPAPTPQEDPPADPLADVRAKLAEIDRLHEEVRKVHGRFGEIKSMISTLQQAQTAAPPNAGAKPALELKRFREELPDYARILEEDLSEAFNSQPKIDPTEINKRVSQEIDQAKKELALQMLDLRHPDWRDLKDSGDFVTWKSSLAEDAQAELNQSWDPRFVSKKFDEFKHWRDQKAVDAAAAIAAAEAKATKQQPNQSRLQAAITPKGSAKPAGLEISIEDAFLQGAGEA